MSSESVKKTILVALKKEIADHLIAAAEVASYITDNLGEDGGTIMENLYKEPFKEEDLSIYDLPNSEGPQTGINLVTKRPLPQHPTKGKGNINHIGRAPNREVKYHGSRAKSSMYRGVSLNVPTGKWVARIFANNHNVIIGTTFRTEEEAARAYDRYKINSLHKFDGLNFPVDHQR